MGPSETLRREEIGILTSLPLLRNVVHDLEEARNNNGSSLTVYFTKESHIHTLVNLVLLSGLPIANRRIPELDYAERLGFPRRHPSSVLTNAPSHISPLNYMSGITAEAKLTKNIRYAYP